MLSRVADNLYWMSRYLERAEHTVRVLEVNMGLMLDRSSTSTDSRWRRVLAALGNPEVEWEGDFYKLAHALTFDWDTPASISSCIITARDNARQVRDELSTEQWQRLNRLYHQVTDLQSTSDSYTSLTDFLSAVLDGVHLFQGVTDSTMSHGEGWQFIQMGRYIERASSTATLLDIYQREIFSVQGDMGDGYQYLEWIGLLRSCTAFEAYCTVYTAELTHGRILEFLLLNRDFPHSLRYSVDCLRSAILAIQQEGGRQPADELTRLAGRMQASLNFVQVSEIMEHDTGEYLLNILRECLQIHRLIYKFYIHYSVHAALAT